MKIIMNFSKLAFTMLVASSLFVACSDEITVNTVDTQYTANTGSIKSAGQAVVIVIKSINPRQPAAIISDIDHDVVVVRPIADHILTGHNAVGTHLAVGEHTHLERGVCREREVLAFGSSNLRAVGVRSLAVSGIYQYGSLG